MTKPRIKFWVLLEAKSKRTNYFDVWTDIGPKATQDIGKAARFRTRRAAMGSRAYSFSWTSYEPHPVRAINYCDRCDGCGWHEGGKTI